MLPSRNYLTETFPSQMNLNYLHYLHYLIQYLLTLAADLNQCALVKDLLWKYPVRDPTWKCPRLMVQLEFNGGGLKYHRTGLCIVVPVQIQTTIGAEISPPGHRKRPALPSLTAVEGVLAGRMIFDTLVLATLVLATLVLAITDPPVSMLIHIILALSLKLLMVFSQYPDLLECL